MGNRNWMRSREGRLESYLFGENGLAKSAPNMTPDASDTASFA